MKKFRWMALIPLVFLTGVSLIGCQSWNRSANLVLYNRSDRPVYYSVSCDSSRNRIKLTDDNILKPGDSVRPYLLYGPEGGGPDKNPWINAINQGDDSALHVFFSFIDYKNDPNPGDSLFFLIVRRSDYKVDSLTKMKWKIVYQ